MTQITENILTATSYILFILLIFVAVFDSSGGIGIGTMLWSPPTYIVAIATIIGNVAWMMGIVHWGLFVAVSLIAIDSDVTLPRLSSSDVYIVVFRMLVGLFVLGSGFWFTGMGLFGWSIMILVVNAHITTKDA